MARDWTVWCALILLGFAGGCTYCASPYDECGPLFGGSGPYACAPNVRAGSNLSGEVAPPVAPVAPPVAPQPETPGVAPAGYFPVPPAEYVAPPAGQPKSPITYPPAPQSRRSSPYQPNSVQRTGTVPDARYGMR